METTISAAGEMPAGTARDRWLALRRGFMGRCPHCGEGKLFRAYLKVNDACPACGEALHHQRADDAPPYFTILITAHVVGALILLVEDRFEGLSLWVHAMIWPALVIGLSAALLPRIKGALVGWQWALGMHGFGGPTD